MNKLGDSTECECSYCEKTVKATTKTDGVYSGKSGETTDVLAVICDECGDVIEIIGNAQAAAGKE
ncbi:hypothetical protein LMH73_009095 [Vibrio splendidus]|nr:hypothetical protein [Vibrio splendidus]MCC4880320.1 hypothetical protein [Vibrio splendidus]